jgi:hypothetical protein
MKWANDGARTNTFVGFCKRESIFYLFLRIPTGIQAASRENTPTVSPSVSQNLAGHVIDFLEKAMGGTSDIQDI